MVGRCIDWRFEPGSVIDRDVRRHGFESLWQDFDRQTCGAGRGFGNRTADGAGRRGDDPNLRQVVL